MSHQDNDPRWRDRKEKRQHCFGLKVSKKLQSNPSNKFKHEYKRPYEPPIVCRFAAVPDMQQYFSRRSIQEKRYQITLNASWITIVHSETKEVR